LPRHSRPCISRFHPEIRWSNEPVYCRIPSTTLFLLSTHADSQGVDIYIYNRTAPMSRHARGLRAGTDGRARQARAATGERRPPAGRNRRLGRRRGRGLRGRTNGAGRVQARLADWADLADGRASRRTAQIEQKTRVVSLLPPGLPPRIFAWIVSYELLCF